MALRGRGRSTEMPAGESRAWLRGPHGGLGAGSVGRQPLSCSRLQCPSWWKVFRSWCLSNGWEWVGQDCLRLATDLGIPNTQTSAQLPCGLQRSQPRGCTLLGSSALSVFHHNTERGVAGKAICVGGWREYAGCQLQW